MSRSQRVHPFPFVVGFARSGTTLVRAMLDSHREMAIPGESHFIVTFVRDRHRYERTEGFDTPAFLHDLSEHPRFIRWELSDDLVRRSLAEDPPADLANAIREIYALYARGQGKSRFGDKTPSYVLHIAMLANLLPEARFVHVVRDGRDVCLSHLDVTLGQRTVEGVALNWMHHVTRGRSAGRRLGPSRYLELRYETLVADPESAMGAVCEFIDLRFDPDMLRYFERADAIRQPTQHPEAHERLGLPPTKGLRDWRTQMPREDLALFEVLAGDLLSELGYEPSEIRPRGIRGLHVRGRAIKAKTSVLAHRVRKRVLPRARS